MLMNLFFPQPQQKPVYSRQIFGIGWTIYPNCIEIRRGFHKDVIPLRNIVRVEKLQFTNRTRIYLMDRRKVEIRDANIADILKRLI